MKLTKYLKAVQALQAKALNRSDIRMFEVDARHYEDGDTSLWVTTQDMGREKFNYFTLYSLVDQEQNDAVLSELTAWLEGAE